MTSELNKILYATDFIQEKSKELGYDNSGTLSQLLDELDTLALNTLEEDDDE